MKLNFEHISQNYYNITGDEQPIGTLQRGQNYNWILNIPQFNIHQEGQYRQALMDYAEKKLKEESH